MSLPKELTGAFQYRMAMAWQRVDDPAKVEPWFCATRRASPSFPTRPPLMPAAQAMPTPRNASARRWALPATPA